MQRELDRLYEVIDTGFKGVHERMDAQNGRTRVLETKVAVLEDRSVPRQAATIGGVVSALVIALVEFAQWVLKK